MKFPYDIHFQPPFPVLPIRLSNEQRGNPTETLMALVDTGADGSLVPLSILRQIRAPAVMDKRLRSHWGEWRAVQMFVVDVELVNRKLPSVLVVGDELGEEVVIGRNLLNRLRLLLDGPAQLTELQ